MKINKIVLAVVLGFLTLNAWAEPPLANIEAIGASNTAGVGTSVPLLARLREHLLETGAAATLANKRVLITIDYFFPTNFPEIDDLSHDPTVHVNQLLQSWQSNHDLVLVALLPTRDQLSERQARYVNTLDPYGGYANVMDVLGDKARRLNVDRVNAVIRAWAKNNPKARVLNLENMMDVSFDLAIPNGMHPVTLFQMDLTHFNDLGQAVAINSVILPVLAPGIAPLDVAGVSDQERRQMMSDILSKVSEYRGDKDGAYWAKFQSLDNFSLKKAQLTGQGQSGFDDLQKIGSEVEGYIHVADSGFPLYVSTLEGKRSFSLDLSHAFMYGLVRLSETSPGVYEAWSYDYWMSISFINPPRTNYHFVLKATSDPLVFNLDFTTYPAIQGQARPILRIYNVDDATAAKVKAAAPGLPALRYNVNLTIVDPSSI